MNSVRLTEAQLRGVIRDVLAESDASLNGIQEWQLREDVSGFVDKIRARIKSFILVNKSCTAVDQQEAIAAMNGVCDKLEANVHDLLEETLFAFIRQV